MYTGQFFAATFLHGCSIVPPRLVRVWDKQVGGGRMAAAYPEKCIALSMFYLFFTFTSPVTVVRSISTSPLPFLYFPFSIFSAPSQVTLPTVVSASAS